MVTTAPAETKQLTLASPAGRWVLLACVLGSGLAGIDSTVVNIALPDIGRALGADFASLQWTVTGYTLTLASLILLGGALGDRYGRRRIFVLGTTWFTVASMLCAVAPSVELLIAARVLQGVGGALLTPASLAILEATFADADRARAIGAWSGLSGAASAIAPFVGGWLLAAGSWRWVFLINVPLAAIVITIAVRHMPENRGAPATGRLDAAGAALCVTGLGGVTGGIIAASGRSLLAPAVWVPVVVGLIALAAFVAVERSAANPLLPPSLFRSHLFTATNAVTFLLYAANGGGLLLLVLELETVSSFTPLRAGTALLPITVIMLALAARFGALSQRVGPRVLMTLGPVVSATGLALFAQLDTSSGYWLDVLPAVAVFGLGLAIFVAPLTSTVLGAVPASHAGVASGVNNAVARAAGLLAIAALPVIAGITGRSYDSAALYLPAFRTAMWICVSLHLAAALLAALAVRDGSARQPRPPTPAVTLAGEHCLTSAG